MNYGFIYENPRPSDFIYGGVSRLGRVALKPDRQWTPPNFENQMSKYTEMMACVSFSALNCLEILSKEKYGKDLNWSDRFTAKQSGTTRKGNTFVAVADSIRRDDGLINETQWPMPLEALWEDYYKAIPTDLVKTGKDYLTDIKIDYEWVSDTSEQLWDALQYAPLQVGIYAYGMRNLAGIYQRTGGRGNHAVAMIGGEYKKYFLIADHYANEPLKKLAWNTMFWGAIRYDITPSGDWEGNNYMQFQENTLYQLVDGIGGFYLFAGGKLRKDSLDTILASWSVRNDGDTRGKVATLTNKDLAGVPVFNLKNVQV